MPPQKGHNHWRVYAILISVIVSLFLFIISFSLYEVRQLRLEFRSFEKKLLVLEVEIYKLRDEIRRILVQKQVLHKNQENEEGEKDDKLQNCEAIRSNRG